MKMMHYMQKQSRFDYFRRTCLKKWCSWCYNNVNRISELEECAEMIFPYNCISTSLEKGIGTKGL